MNRNLHTRIARRTAVLCVAALVGLTVAAVASAGDYADFDGNGYIDAHVREAGFFYYSGSGHVGAKCETFFSNGVRTTRITIRPPKVWPLAGLSSQTVTWSAVWINTANGQAVYSPFLSATSYATQPTVFGGSGDSRYSDPHTGDYWKNAWFHDFPRSDGKWAAYVYVSWTNPYTGATPAQFLNVRRYLVSDGTSNGQLYSDTTC